MKKTTFLAIALGAMMFSSCDIFNQLASDVASVANLRNCEFNLKNVNNVSVAGVNVKNLTQGQLSATDVVKLVAAYQTKKVPLAMNVNVDVKNPTTTQAAMTALDWILAIDGKDMANGINSQRYTIRPSATTTVPLGVNTDLGDLFSKEGVEKLKNFASSFTKDGTSSKVGLRVKPSKKSNAIRRLMAGDTLTVIAVGKTWSQVKDPETGKTGYVANDYIRKA